MDFKKKISAELKIPPVSKNSVPAPIPDGNQKPEADAETRTEIKIPVLTIILPTLRDSTAFFFSF